MSHFFIAIPLSDALKDKLSKWCMTVEPPFQRFVHEQDYHITLAFLGSVEPSQLETLIERLAKVSLTYAPFSLTVSNLGHFGQKQAPRIFWAGVQKEDQLFQLQKSVYDTCIETGFQLEERLYSPHITLARKYVGEGTYNDESLQKSFQENVSNETWEITSFAIYQTHIKELPKYERIASFSLTYF